MEDIREAYDLKKSFMKNTNYHSDLDFQYELSSFQYLTSYSNNSN